nr:MAG: hypothetical protein DIU78_25820 [Pseudomonadota bacterium]
MAARHSTEQSVLGASTRVTGRVGGEGSLRIEGQLKGDVQVTGDTEIAEGASVEGNVTAESVEVAGTLVGDVAARGTVAVRAGALVRGELKATEVSIEPGARVLVRIETDLELDLGPPRRR